MLESGMELGLCCVEEIHSQRTDQQMMRDWPSVDFFVIQEKVIVRRHISRSVSVDEDDRQTVSVMVEMTRYVRGCHSMSLPSLT